MGCQVANTEQLNAGLGIDFKQIGWGSLTSTIFNRLHVFPFFGCSVAAGPPAIYDMTNSIGLLGAGWNRYNSFSFLFFLSSFSAEPCGELWMQLGHA